jgi:hypothetical protein
MMHILDATGSRVLRRILVTRKDEVERRWRKTA